MSILARHRSPSKEQATKEPQQRSTSPFNLNLIKPVKRPNKKYHIINLNTIEPGLLKAF